MKFNSHNVLDCRSSMNCRHAGNRTFSHVYCHSDAVFIAHIAEFFGFKRTAYGQQIGVSYRYAVLFKKRTEALCQINIFTCCKRNITVFRNADIMIGIHPRLYIFKPCNVIFFKSFCKFYTVLHRNMTEMIYCEGKLIAYGFSYLFYVIFKKIHTLFGDMYSRGIMRNGKGFVVFAEHHVTVNRTALVHDCFH